MKIVNDMNVMVGFYDEDLLNHQREIIDSLIGLEKYDYRQKDSIKDAVLARTKIKPWTLLSPEDKEYMSYQIKRYNAVKWTNLSPYFTLSRSKSARRISLPILSKNKKYALIFV